MVIQYFLVFLLIGELMMHMLSPIFVISKSLMLLLQKNQKTNKVFFIIIFFSYLDYL
jgi:uncharacterized membrane protein (DUF373 family)